MQSKTSETESCIDLEPRDVRALTECMSVLDGFGDATAGEYVVVSESGSQYDIDVLVGTCTCPDHEYRGVRCKHLRGAEFASGRREIPEWVDRDAINNTLGDHIDAGPVFADAVGVGDGVTAKATERAVTDGGTVVSESEPQDEDTKAGCPYDHVDCEGVDADTERPVLCPTCWEEWAAYDEEDLIIRSIEEITL